MPQILSTFYCNFETSKTYFLRTNLHKQIANPTNFKQQLLVWSQQFREVVFLDSNAHQDSYSQYDCILAVDAFTSLKTDQFNAFEDLKQYQQTTQDWLFGYLSYDLKNDVEVLYQTSQTYNAQPTTHNRQSITDNRQPLTYSNEFPKKYTLKKSARC